MYWYQYVALGALLYCAVAFALHFVKIVRLGKPKDLSRKSGNVGKGVLYANTAAMMPGNKESAYLHLPTYTVGIVYHLGTFVSILSFFLLLIHPVAEWLYVHVFVSGIFVGFLSVSTLAGFGLFCKRLFKKELRSLSHPDDYVSNLSTTLFQLTTCLMFGFLGGSATVEIIYYMVCTWLLLYLPLGKLRHVLYYFSARYHLGFFYGWRNVWPQQKND